MKPRGTSNPGARSVPAGARARAAGSRTRENRTNSREPNEKETEENQMESVTGNRTQSTPAATREHRRGASRSFPVPGGRSGGRSPGPAPSARRPPPARAHWPLSGEQQPMGNPEALATGAGRDFERDGLSDGQRERSSGPFRFPTVSPGPFRCRPGRSRSLPVRRAAVQVNSAVYGTRPEVRL